MVHNYSDGAMELFCGIENKKWSTILTTPMEEMKQLTFSDKNAR